MGGDFQIQPSQGLWSLNPNVLRLFTHHKDFVMIEMLSHVQMVEMLSQHPATLVRDPAPLMVAILRLQPIPQTCAHSRSVSA